MMIQITIQVSLSLYFTWIKNESTEGRVEIFQNLICKCKLLEVYEYIIVAANINPSPRPNCISSALPFRKGHSIVVLSIVRFTYSYWVR